METIAERTADLLWERMQGEPATADEYVDAASAGRLIKMSARYMREHADEFGAVRVGKGPKARLRFDPERVIAARRASGAPEEKPATPAQRRTRRRGSGASTVRLLEPKGPSY